MPFDVSRDEGGKIDAHTVPELRRGNMAKKGLGDCVVWNGFNDTKQKLEKKTKTSRGGCSSTHPDSLRLDRSDETSLNIRQVEQHAALKYEIL